MLLLPLDVGWAEGGKKRNNVFGHEISLPALHLSRIPPPGTGPGLRLGRKFENRPIFVENNPGVVGFLAPKKKNENKKGSSASNHKFGANFFFLNSISVLEH